jgi:hypothetical protein
MRTWWSPLACAAALSVLAAPSAAAEYRPPRLADGHPDLQGVWDFVNATPLERPPGIATLTITREQAADIDRALEQVAEDRSLPAENTDYFNQRRLLPIRGELHSSIIVIRRTAGFRHGRVQAMAGARAR